jgi:hypothetical protein
MKRLSKTHRGQFALSLYREPLQQFDGPTKEELLNVLADLLREALSGETKANEEQEEKSNESENQR